MQKLNFIYKIMNMKKKILKRKKISPGMNNAWSEDKRRTLNPNCLSPGGNDDDKNDLIQKKWLMERQLQTLQKRVEELEKMNMLLLAETRPQGESPWSFYIS